MRAYELLNFLWTFLAGTIYASCIWYAVLFGIGKNSGWLGAISLVILILGSIMLMCYIIGIFTTIYDD